jgi:rubrerythrin
LYNFDAPISTYSTYGMDFTFSALNTALGLIIDALQKERVDELNYNYLIENAPTQEEADIIASIRDDDRLHRQWYRDIVRYYTNQEVEINDEAYGFTEPSSYLDGIKNSMFDELSDMAKYRIIREGLPSRFLRDVVLRILTDEMKHATLYNYIITINK